MELALFIIIGAVAVISAAMMLISENAVYSALLLILNFACIAFFFLMLNAPFLFMVQITVYAGAIMVLFLFVIMLLGAERLMPVAEGSFRWLAPSVIVLALVFLVAASVAIIQGEVALTDPHESNPQVRVVNVLDDVPAIDVYLDGEALARDLAFHEHTDFETQEAGRYTLAVYGAGTDPARGEPLLTQQVDLNADEALTFAAVGRLADPALAVATEERAYSEEKDELRVVAINGLPDRPLVDVVDETGDDDDVLIEDLAFGQTSTIEMEKGTYTVGLYPDGNDRNRILTLDDVDLAANSTMLWVFAEQRRPDNSFAAASVVIEAKTQGSFGGPTHVGQLLFSKYVLPFEMVGILLLVAMIGAIVLTHEKLGPRPRPVRRLANAPSVTDETGQR